MSTLNLCALCVTLMLHRRYFAAEIIGNIAEVEPRRWRRPRRIDSHHNKDRVKKFQKRYEPFDWTGMIESA